MTTLTVADVAGYLAQQLRAHAKVTAVAREQRSGDESLVWVSTSDHKSFCVAIIDEDTVPEVSGHRHDYTDIDAAILAAIKAGHNTQAAIFLQVKPVIDQAWNARTREPLNILMVRMQRLKRKQIIHFSARSQTWRVVYTPTNLYRP